MNQSQQPRSRKSLPLLPSFFGLAVLAVVLAAGGFGFAASQESRDSFCASCHTQPESTFYQRADSAQSPSNPPVDLASYHTTQNTRCIDCHSGQGVVGRMKAELMGARNAAKWYTGTAIQPAVMTYAIGDGNCLKCHQDVVQRDYTPKEQITLPFGEGFRGEGEGGGEGGGNHWHAFMSRWQAATPTAGTCVSCHAGHDTTSTASAGFMNSQNVRATCDTCHQVLRREGRD